MKPVIGPAPEIIRSAMSLGILCRPVENGWVGTALKPGPDSFEYIDAESNNYGGLFNPTPHQFCLDWMLTTGELLVAECREYAQMLARPF